MFARANNKGQTLEMSTIPFAHCVYSTLINFLLPNQCFIAHADAVHHSVVLSKASHTLLHSTLDLTVRLLSTKIAMWCYSVCRYSRWKFCICFQSMENSLISNPGLNLKVPTQIYCVLCHKPFSDWDDWHWPWLCLLSSPVLCLPVLACSSVYFSSQTAV